MNNDLDLENKNVVIRFLGFKPEEFKQSIKLKSDNMEDDSLMERALKVNRIEMEDVTVHFLGFKTDGNTPINYDYCIYCFKNNESTSKEEEEYLMSIEVIAKVQEKDSFEMKNCFEFSMIGIFSLQSNAEIEQKTQEEKEELISRECLKVLLPYVCLEVTSIMKTCSNALHVYNF